jgi:hypothetical protein
MMKFRRQSPKGHRADPVPYAIHLGDYQGHALYCGECGFDLEPEPQGRFRHLATRRGADREVGR